MSFRSYRLVVSLFIAYRIIDAANLFQKGNNLRSGDEDLLVASSFGQIEAGVVARPQALLRKELKQNPSLLRDWYISQGKGCEVNELDNCIQTVGYKSHNAYPSSSTCEITVESGVEKVLQVEDFNTEQGYDCLTVNDKEYSGSATALDGVKPVGKILWEADKVVEGYGWKVCLTGSSAPIAHESETDKEPVQASAGIALEMKRSCGNKTLEEVLQVSDKYARRLNYGSSQCKCIGLTGSGGKAMINFIKNAVEQTASYPSDVGSYCKDWDRGEKTCDVEPMPKWCMRQWCFVDPCHCDLEVLPSKVESFLPGAQIQERPLYFSYATCARDRTMMYWNAFDALSCYSRQDANICNDSPTCAWSTNMKKCVRKEMLSICEIVPRPQISGKQDCPCVAPTGLNGLMNIRINEDMHTYPLDAGASCRSWDEGRHPSCVLEANETLPGTQSRWCKRRWCFVDPCNCRLKERPTIFYGAVSSGSQLYHSYATCGSEALPNVPENKLYRTCSYHTTERACRAATSPIKPFGDCRWLGDFCGDSEIAEVCSVRASRKREMAVRFEIHGVDFKKLKDEHLVYIKQKVLELISDELVSLPVRKPEQMSMTTVLLSRAELGTKVVVNSRCPEGLTLDECKLRLFGTAGQNDISSIGAKIVQKLQLFAAIVDAMDGLGNLSATKPLVVFGQQAKHHAASLIANVMQPTEGSAPAGMALVGTPPSPVKVVFDSGSDQFVIESLVTVNKYLSEWDSAMVDVVVSDRTLYDHNRSATWARTKSGGDQQNISFGSSNITFLRSADTVQVAGIDNDYFQFGEITEEKVKLLQTEANVNGIMGLMHLKNRTKGDNVSIFSSMRSLGAMYAFGYCLMNYRLNVGAFIWGDEQLHQVDVPVLGDASWTVEMSRFELKPQSGESQVFEYCGGADPAARKCVASIDTGSNVIAGPRDFLVALAAFLNVSTDCTNVDQLPTLMFNLGPQQISLTPEAYILRISTETGVNGSSFLQSDPTVMRVFDSEVERLAKERGVDLRVALGVKEGWKLPNMDTSSGYICMPAFSGYDRQSFWGPVFVLGRPLFVKYHAKFSWDQATPAPKLNFAPVRKAQSCLMVNQRAWDVKEGRDDLPPTEISPHFPSVAEMRTWGAERFDLTSDKTKYDNNIGRPSDVTPSLATVLNPATAVVGTTNGANATNSTNPSVATNPSGANAGNQAMLSASFIQDAHAPANAPSYEEQLAFALDNLPLIKLGEIRQSRWLDTINDFL